MTLRESAVIPEDAQEHFWAVVECCLREFHPDLLAPALERVQEVQAKLDLQPLDVFELFFHSEPWDVACSMARRDLKVEDYLDRYLEIRDIENYLAP